MEKRCGKTKGNKYEDKKWESDQTLHPSKDFVLTTFPAEKSASGSQQQQFWKSTVKQDATACFLFRNSKSVSIGF